VLSSFHSKVLFSPVQLGKLVHNLFGQVVVFFLSLNLHLKKVQRDFVDFRNVFFYHVQFIPKYLHWHFHNDFARNSSKLPRVLLSC
jgi:hypothetical protein